MDNNFENDPKVYELNRRLSRQLQKKYSQAKLKADESHVINDFFLSIIQETRDELGFGDSVMDWADYESNPSPLAIEQWAISHIVVNWTLDNPGPWSQDDYLQEFNDWVLAVICNCHLPDGWSDYVAAFLVLNKRPIHTPVSKDLPISVIGISESDITISIENGTSSADYKEAWKVLKDITKSGLPYRPTFDSLKNRILLERRGGATISAIAKKYFKEQYDTDKESAKQRVKKLISYHKKTQ